MLYDNYFDAACGTLEHLRTTQQKAIEDAADIIVRSVQNSGAVFCSGIGHGIEHDFISRAGGLALVRQLSFDFRIKDDVADCLAERPGGMSASKLKETVLLALRTGNIRAGDVVLIGSVSGRGERAVELAICCRELKINTIGLTSMEYAAKAEPAHDSGKLLHEVVDAVIDHGAPHGDAAVEIPGLEIAALPVSGLGALATGWMLWEQVIRKMIETGEPPTVFLSINRTGGPEFYEACLAKYNERGF